ncbi:MAG: TIGR02217 family protein, partial [Paracoccaceae bacterium]
ERNSPWARSRRRYDAGLGVRSFDDLAAVLTFFEARHGRLFAFRWKDWLDHKSSVPSVDVTPGDVLLEGTGNTRQLVRRYTDNGGSYTRPVTKPVAGTVRVGVDGVELNEGGEFAVNTETGVVTLVSDPGVADVTAGFEFDVPVRFDTDVIEANLATFEAGEIPSIPIIEVRD